MPTVSAHDVATELRKRLPDVGTKKLHKLLYYCQGHHLATFGTPLFPETISAWDMGLVVGSLWKWENDCDAPMRAAVELTEAELNTVGYVVSRYGALTGADLERLTHSEGPWVEANHRRLPRTSAKIPVESIRSYFAAVSSDDSDQDTPMPDAEAVAALLEGAQSRLRVETHVDSIEELHRRLSVGA